MTGSDAIGFDPTLDHRAPDHRWERQGSRVRAADPADLADLGFDPDGYRDRPLRGTLL